MNSIPGRTTENTVTPKVILGVDTSLRSTGYAVIRMNAPGKYEILDCGVIKNKASLIHSECLYRIAGGIRELVDTFHPDTASIESAFVQKNIKTAMILSLARGAVITALAEKKIEIYEYAPTTAKRSAIGRGTATKEQVAVMMAAVCGIDVSGVPDDSTDALALAVCHANTFYGDSRFSASGKKV
jgi:crossover junction endodeoxyribonuclease RuvC